MKDFVQMTLALSKKCTVCGVEKSLDNYFIDKRGKYGRYAKCKPCHNLAVRISSSKPKSKENRSKRLSSQREHINERQRKYWKNHPGLKKYHSDYAKAHPEIGRQAVNRRRVRKMSAAGYHTAEEWKVLCDNCKNTCLSCNQQKPLTKDHIVPLSRGGTDWIDNIQPLCNSCNASKGVKIIDYRCNDD